MLRIIFNPNSNFVKKHRDKVKINNNMQHYIELKQCDDVLMPEDILEVEYIQVMGDELFFALNILFPTLMDTKYTEKKTQYFFAQDMMRILSHYISSVAHVETR